MPSLVPVIEQLSKTSTPGEVQHALDLLASANLSQLEVANHLHTIGSLAGYTGDPRRRALSKAYRDALAQRGTQ